MLNCFGFEAPAVKNITLTERQNRLYESYPYHKGGARERSERPPAGREKSKKVFETELCNKSFRFSRFVGHAVSCAHDPDLGPHKSFSMNLSGTPKLNHVNLHISKPKLTGAY